MLVVKMPMRKLLGALLFGSIACLLIPSFSGSPAAAEEKKQPAAETPGSEATSGSSSRSIGSTSRGRLRNAVTVSDSSVLRFKKSTRARYGTAEMLSLLQKAAQTVEDKHSKSTLLLGDISREKGGRISPHKSHRAGRDVDVSFYWKDEQGNPTVPRSFVQVKRSGRGELQNKTYVFDAERNWTFVEALLKSDEVHVQYIFVANYIQKMMYAAAEKMGASQIALARAKIAMQQPGYGSPHTTHFHVRIYCAKDDRPECKDSAPFWDWVEKPPAEARVVWTKSQRRRMKRKRVATAKRRKARARRRKANAKKRREVRKRRAARKRARAKKKRRR